MCKAGPLSAKVREYVYLKLLKNPSHRNTLYYPYKEEYFFFCLGGGGSEAIGR